MTQFPTLQNEKRQKIKVLYAMASTDPKNEYKLTTNIYNAMQVT